MSNIAKYRMATDFHGYKKSVLIVLFVIIQYGLIHCDVIKKYYDTILNSYIANSNDAPSEYSRITRVFCATALNGKPLSFSKQNDICHTNLENTLSDKYIVEPHSSWDTYVDPTWDDSLTYSINEGQEVMFGDTTSSTGLSHVIHRVTVVGGSVWMLYSRENFAGKRFMATEGEWTEFFGFTGSIVNSIQKIGNECSNRPIGVQNPFIIPDSSLMVDDAHGGDDFITHARLYFADGQAFGFDYNLDQHAGFYTRSPTYWGEPVIFTINLGSLYRVYGVATQQLRGYHANVFHILYTPYEDATIAHFQTYQENGNDKLFEISRADQDDVEYREFTPPILARYIAHSGVSGRVHYNGLRLEYYGCAIDSDKMSYSKTNDVTCSDTGSGVIINADDLKTAQFLCSQMVPCDFIQHTSVAEVYTLKSSCVQTYSAGNYLYRKYSAYTGLSSADLSGTLTTLDDLDTSTCIATIEQITYLRHPVPASLTEETVTVTLYTSSDDPLCDATKHVFVHRSNDVTADSGLFSSCEDITSTSSVQPGTDVYNCQCTYGVCEYVFTRFEYVGTSFGCFHLCEVRFA